MPFIPHTEQDVFDMLEVIGVTSVEALFEEIPATLRHSILSSLPAGLSEMALTRFIQTRAQQQRDMLCFIGAGAYEHHIPAAVWDIATRGEFMTAYTPYQAEASQGSLQLLYEYQTMMASLMGMEVSNASLYEGASALAEALLMAVRLSTKKTSPQILLPKTLHPHYRQVVKSILSQQAIEVIELPYDMTSGRLTLAIVQQYITDNVVALALPQPNFFGVLEEVDGLTDYAKAQDVLVVGVVNPLAMALLKPPGQWGEQGADIACGEGQPLGIPLAAGGPYYGFLCCKKAIIRQMPGRIVGQTQDVEGKPGYVLTLQTREQHIRRGKATSNICTNQGLMVTASTIYMSLLGPQGLRRVALACHQATRDLRVALTAIPEVELVFTSPFFHEIVIRVPQAKKLLHVLAERGIQGGYALEEYYPELADCLLLCATETKTAEDIKLLTEVVRGNHE